MASWRKAKLSSTSLRRVQEVNASFPDERLPGIRGRLLEDAMARERQARPQRYGLLMDPQRPQRPVATPVDEKPPPQAVDTHELAAKIVEIVCKGQTGVNIVIELVSQVPGESLDDLVTKCWSMLVEDEHKKSFVIAMSATRTTALCVGSTILLPLLSESETFQSTIELYGSVFGWLESNFSHSTVVPLLLNEHSAINQDPNSCKILLNHMSEIQKTEAVVVFCKSVQHLQECHLQSLCAILESPVDPSVVQPVAAMLGPRMDEYSENRTVGKMISSLIALLAASPTTQTYSEVSSLASLFKGPMRFRHKQALAKISKQIQSS